MIIKETVTIDGRVFTHTHSDTYKIRKIGTDEIYSEAVDLPEIGFSYIETDIEIEEEEQMIQGDRKAVLFHTYLADPQA